MSDFYLLNKNFILLNKNKGSCIFMVTLCTQNSTIK